MLTTVQDRPVNGFDLSHWSGALTRPMGETLKPWYRYVGIKAAHIGGNRMIDGVDPQFKATRSIVGGDARWIGLYLFLAPASVAPVAVQVAKFAENVGPLREGEFMYVDWENSAATGDASYVDFVEALDLLQRVYPGRVAAYVNDDTGDRTTWLKARTVPVIHPNWTDTGKYAALSWGAVIWQCVGSAPNPYTKGPTSFDFVLDPARLDQLCGR